MVKGKESDTLYANKDNLAVEDCEASSSQLNLCG
jgi:hypothetical protein